MPYNIDFGRFEEKHKDTYWIEGWFFEPGHTSVRLEVVDEQARQIPCKIEFRKRPDVRAAFRCEEAEGQIGFSVRIPGLKNQPAFRKVILQAVQAEKRVVLFEKDITELLQESEDDRLRIFVDQICGDKNEYHISGWITDATGEAQLTLQTGKGRAVSFSLQKTERPDIIAHYNIADEKCAYGFIIGIRKQDFPKDKLIIKVREETNCKSLVLDGRYVRRKDQVKAFKQRCRGIKNIPVILARLQTNGWERYMISRNRAEQPEYENYMIWRQEHLATQYELRKLYKKYGTQSEKKIWSFQVGSGTVYETKSAWENLGQKLAVATCEASKWILLMGEGVVCEAELPYRFLAYLEKNPEMELVYSDHDECRETAVIPFMKSEFNLELLRNWNYIGPCFMISEELLKKVYQFGTPAGFHDVLLKAAELSRNIGHVALPLFHLTGSERTEESINSIRRHLERSGLPAEVRKTGYTGIYRVSYHLKNRPLISIVILNKDHKEDLEQCLNSVFENTTYEAYEILIGENNSETEEIFEFYRRLQSEHDNVHVHYWNGEFNYSAINNLLIKKCRGEYIVLLNNDIEVISPDWLENMLGFCQRQDVGAVGVKLYYPDNTVQHAGVILGLEGIAGHVLTGAGRNESGCMNRLITNQEISLVTAACLMVRKDYYEQVGGMDEQLKVAFNDVDFCIKLREHGLKNIFTPYTEMYHYESKSRGQDNTAEKIRRFGQEVILVEKKWKKLLIQGDPYYSPVLTMKKNDCSFKSYEEEETDGRF